MHSLIYGFTINHVNNIKSNLPDEVSGRGRPRLPQGEAMVPVMVKMKPSQKEKLQRLGGARWVRDRIDKAKE